MPLVLTRTVNLYNVFLQGKLSNPLHTKNKVVDVEKSKTGVNNFILSQRMQTVD